MPTGVVGHTISRHWSVADKDPVSTRDKRTSPIRALLETISTNKSISTSDRIVGSVTEYTRYYIDPVDGWTIRSSTREVVQSEDGVQTDKTPSEVSLLAGRAKVGTAMRRRALITVQENGSPLTAEEIALEERRLAEEVDDEVYGTYRPGVGGDDTEGSQGSDNIRDSGTSLTGKANITKIGTLLS